MSEVRMRKIQIPSKYEEVAQKAIGNALGRIVAGACPDFVATYLELLEKGKSPMVAMNSKDLEKDLAFVKPNIVDQFFESVGAEIAAFVGPEDSDTHGGEYHLDPMSATMVAAWAAAILNQSAAPQIIVQDQVDGFGEGLPLVRTSEAAMTMEELEQMCDNLPNEIGPDDDIPDAPEGCVEEELPPDEPDGVRDEPAPDAPFGIPEGVPHQVMQEGQVMQDDPAR